MQQYISFCEGVCKQCTFKLYRNLIMFLKLVCHHQFDRLKQLINHVSRCKQKVRKCSKAAQFTGWPDKVAPPKFSKDNFFLIIFEKFWASLDKIRYLENFRRGDFSGSPCILDDACSRIQYLILRLIASPYSGSSQGAARGCASRGAAQDCASRGAAHGCASRGAVQGSVSWGAASACVTWGASQGCASRWAAPGCAIHDLVYVTLMSHTGTPGQLSPLWWSQPFPKTRQVYSGGAAAPPVLSIFIIAVQEHMKAEDRISLFAEFAWVQYIW
jgi:hypothetical protein